MFADKRIFGTALFAAMLSGAFVGFFSARGTAYVPSLVAPALSNNPLGFLTAMLVGLGTACILTIVQQDRQTSLRSELIGFQKFIQHGEQLSAEWRNRQ